MAGLNIKYKNLPLKKALNITAALSFFTALLLAALIALATRPSYYKLVASDAGEALIMLHDLFTVLAIGSTVCIIAVLGIYLFYRWKLSAPLEVLSKGVEQIAENNLDFSMPYDSEDELGALCRSFDRMRDELQRNYKKMWRMTEERKKLNASFAHDLRTPLTVLRGYTDFLEEYIPSPDKRDEKLLETNRMMAQYIRRLEDYVEMMTAIQKLEDTPIHLSPVLAGAFIDMIKDNVKSTAEEYGKDITVKDELSLSLICGDVSLIFRVLENVVRNALEYCESRAQVRVFEEAGMLFIEVTDDGPGFRDKDAEQALNPFYTSSGAGTSHFGIGLTVCRTLCENHGGAVLVGNTQDSGAKVTVSFLLGAPNPNKT